MDLKITIEWLKNRAALDQGAEVAAGCPDIEALVKEAIAIRQTPGERLILGEAFGKLVYFMRHERHLSVDDLARTADVESEELEKIESSNKYVPEPRTVYQLAKVFNLPDQKMMELSGNLVARDPDLTVEAERFAANAKHIDQLSGDQNKVLMAFVRYLAQKR